MERLTFGALSQPHFEQHRRTQAQSLWQGSTEQLVAVAGGAAGVCAAGDSVAIAGSSARATLGVVTSEAPTVSSAIVVRATILEAPDRRGNGTPHSFYGKSDGVSGSSRNAQKYAAGR
jgi:hypothetical protein